MNTVSTCARANSATAVDEAFLLEEAVETLRNAGVPDPIGDARSLFAFVHESVDGRGGDLSRLVDEVVALRARRVPLAYIIGETSFFDMRLQVGPGVFIPRRQSEDYVRHALEEVASVPSPRIADLFSGSAALALAVAKSRPDARVTAVELADEALVYAQRNRLARRRAGDTPIDLVRADVRSSDLLSEDAGRFDLVLSNPPYVRLGKSIPEEWARHHPPGAVYDDDEEGLSLLRASAVAAARLLAPGGRYVVEHDDEQGQAVRDMLEEGGAFREVETRLDAQGRPRWTAGSRTSNGAVHPVPVSSAQKRVERGSWIRGRLDRTSRSIDICFAEGLTGHVFNERAGKRVRLADGSDAVEFVSCSYLGLEQHPALVDAAREAIDRFGVHFSSSRNRMRPEYLPMLDDGLSRMHDGLPCVSFTSVSAVHLGILPVLGANGLPSWPIRRSGTLFLLERTAHASIQVLRGIMEQIGPVQRFALDDPATLEDGLRRCDREGRTPILLVDGVGSMGGLTDLVALQREAEAHGGYVYVDDAHGTSIAGARGEGYAAACFEEGLPANVILVGSLSKAFGGAGGYVVLRDPADVSVVRKSANPLVFGHSIMLPLLAADVASIGLHLDGTVRELQGRLAANLETFDALTNGVMSNAGLATPIRGLRIRGEDRALDAARTLRRAGILVLPAFYPTVEQGSGLLRFALSATHEPDQIARAASVIAAIRADAG